MRKGRTPITLLIAALVLVGATLGACSPLASKGTMPPPGPSGQVDPSKVPDFIAVAGSDGSIAGYVRKEAVLPAGGAAVGQPSDRSWPVYGEDLRTVVGQMVPGKGFVPAGVDPATVSAIPVEVAPSSESGGEPSGQVSLYVRNGAAAQVWIAILDGGQFLHGGGFWGEGYVGVGCFPMSSGSRLVLLDRAPQEAGATVVRAIYARGQEAEPPALWIELGADGRISQGRGVAPWWSGDPQTC